MAKRRGNGRLAKLGFATYDDYLRSAGWRTRRRKAGSAANWTCACGKTATEIHHRTYARIGEEEPDDLRAVCAGCHAAIHRRREAGASLAEATDVVLARVEQIEHRDGYKVVKLAPGKRQRPRRRRKQRLVEAPKKKSKGPAKTPRTKIRKLVDENDRLHALQVRNREQQAAARREREYAASSSPAGAPGGSSDSTRSIDRA